MDVADIFGEEIIIVLGLMIPFLGILVPVLVLFLLQPSRPRPLPTATLHGPAPLDGEDEGVRTAPVAVAAGPRVPAEPAELTWLCEQLRESDVFEALTDEELRLVAGIGQRRRVKAGERLARGGSRGESLFVILAGELSLLTHDASEKPVRTAHPRETVPLAAIIEPPVLVTTVEAHTDAEVFVIPRIRLLDLFDGQPMIALQVYKAAAKSFEHRYRTTLDRAAGEGPAAGE
jgi:hypothetical protein